MESKVKLRQRFQEIRRSISNDYRAKAASMAAELFADSVFLHKNQHFGCYLATEEEFDTSLIIEAIWKAKKTCYVPILEKEQENKLAFVRYEYGMPLHRNRYAILEPAKHDAPLNPGKLEVVVAPVVAFDLYGHRLGMGGGYFDRAFSFTHESYTHKPFIMGLAFALQQADLIPYDPWDINLDGILTENAFLRPFT